MPPSPPLPRFRRLPRPGSRDPFRWPTRRVYTPTILQMEAAECGAAALGMVLASFGRHVPLEQLRSECGVSRNGVNALSMVKVAPLLRSPGRSLPPPRREPGRPAAAPHRVFWNYSHFVVVEGFSRTHALLNDPASGRRKVPRTEFERSYSGAAFAFSRTPAFKAGGRPRSTWQALRKRLGGSETSLAYIILAAFALVIPGLVIPSFTRIFVDELIGAGAPPLDPVAAERHARHGPGQEPADLAEGVLPPAPRDAHGPHLVGRLLLARPASPHRVLQPAVWRGDRVPRGPQRLAGLAGGGGASPTPSSTSS